MARLTMEIRSLIISRLATEFKATEVQRELREEHGLEVPLNQICAHDPRKLQGKGLAVSLKARFFELHEAWKKGESDAAISHRNYRLRKLGDMADKAESRGHLSLAVEIHELVEKINGDYFTNRRVMMPGDTDALADELARTLGIGKDELLTAVAGDHSDGRITSRNGRSLRTA